MGDVRSINVSVLDSDSTVLVKNTTVTTTREFQSPPARHVLRIDAQDDLWTVSVAEDPHCPFSYTLYVKSKYPFTTCRA